jgi:hypothetical protein
MDSFNNNGGMDLYRATLNSLFRKIFI